MFISTIVTTVISKYTSIFVIFIPSNQLLLLHYDIYERNSKNRFKYKIKRLYYNSFTYVIIFISKKTIIGLDMR